MAKETTTEMMHRLLLADYEERKNSLAKKHSKCLEALGRLCGGRATKDDMKLLMALTGVGMEKMVQTNDENYKQYRGRSRGQ